MKKYLLILLLCVLGVPASAQTLAQAKALYEKGEYEKAKPAFKKFVKSQPSNGSYNLYYGVCLLQTGEAEAAVSYLETAVKRRTTSGQLWLGKAYAATYRFEEAVETFEEYISELEKRKRSTEEAKARMELVDTACGWVGVREDDGSLFLTAHDEIGAVSSMVQKLGYDLSEEDILKVYDAFRSIAAKKEQVSAKELDAIVASAAMQVPSAYVLQSYVINAGNTISATAHLKIARKDAILEGVSIGDGPIDAAFLAIEQITGQHYELDDFQLQAVTEGRGAMGQTVVKLRSNGKLYSGRGISTDIVGAGIQAYLSALNKIVYEEEGV